MMREEEAARAQSRKYDRSTWPVKIAGTGINDAGHKL